MVPRLLRLIVAFAVLLVRASPKPSTVEPAITVPVMLEPLLYRYCRSTPTLVGTPFVAVVFVVVVVAQTTLPAASAAHKANAGCGLPTLSARASAPPARDDPDNNSTRRLTERPAH